MADASSYELQGPAWHRRGMHESLDSQVTAVPEAMVREEGQASR